MNTDFADERLIMQYLLGSLPPEETERLDELSTADDDFAGRLQAVENDLVDAYVRGELQGQLLESFQSAYLASPVRRQKVQFARVFQAIADSHPRVSQVMPVAQPGRRSRRRFQMPAWRWGLAAATVLVTISAGWLAFQNAGLRAQRDSALARMKAAEERAQQIAQQLAARSATESKLRNEVPAASIAPFVIALNLAPQLRGAAEIPAIALPRSADYLAIQLELETTASVSYRADLKALPRRQSVWKSGSVASYRRGDGQIVSLTIPRRLLAPSVYVVELSGVSPRGAVELAATYSFRIIRE